MIANFVRCTLLCPRFNGSFGCTCGLIIGLNLDEKVGPNHSTFPISYDSLSKSEVLEPKGLIEGSIIDPFILRDFVLVIIL